MAIGPINQLRNMFSAREAETVRRNSDSSADRDANGRRNDDGSQQKPKNLSPDQEDAAVAKLNTLPSFSGAGLKAVLVRGEGVITHVRVEDGSGAVIRNIPYDHLVDLYLDRNSENGTGRLLRRAA